MENTEKIELIKNFDVNTFLEWQKLFYESSISNEEIEKALSKWNDYLKKIESGESLNSDTDFLKSPKTAIFYERENSKTIKMAYDILDDVVISEQDFESIEFEIKLFIKNDLDEIKARFEYWLTKSEYKAKQIIEQKKASVLDVIDFDLLEDFNKERPITKSLTTSMVAALLSNIQVYQVLENWFVETDTPKNTPSVTSSKQSKIRRKEQMSAKDKVLILNYLGIFDNEFFKNLTENQRAKLLGFLLETSSENLRKTYFDIVKADKSEKTHKGFSDLVNVYF